MKPHPQSIESLLDHKRVGTKGAGRPAATALAIAAALGGCASLGEKAPHAMRIEPVLRISSGSNSGTLGGYQALARQYAGEGRWLKAAETLRQAAALDPRSVDTLNRLGHAEAMLQRYPAAVVAFETAVALAPDRVDLLNNLGYALMLNGRPALAAAVLTMALQRAPDYEAARHNLQLADIRVAELRTAQPSLPVGVAATAPELASTPAVALPLQADPPSLALTAHALAPLASSAFEVLSAPNVPSLQLASVPTLMALPSQAPFAEPVPRPSTDPAAIAARPEPAAVSAQIGQTRIVVVNGNGVTGAAARLGRRLAGLGLTQPRLANLLPYKTATSTVQYRAGFARQARAIADLLPMPSVIEPAAAGVSGEVRVIIGHDVAYSQACTLLAASCQPARPVAQTPTAVPPAV